MKEKPSELLEAIRKEVPEFPVMPESNLKEVHGALFGEMDREREFRKAPPKSKKTGLVVLPRTEAPKAVQKIMELVEKYGAKAYWMKTGLSVKVENEGGYKLNVMNYLNVKERNGKVSGDVYLNQIRNDRLAELINDIPEYKWFKGYLCIKKINSEQVIEMLTKGNMEYLVTFGFESLNSKKAKASNLKSRMKRGKA